MDLGAAASDVPSSPSDAAPSSLAASSAFDKENAGILRPIKKRAGRVHVDELRGHGCHVSPSQSARKTFLGHPASGLRHARSPRRLRFRFDARVTCIPHPFKHGAGEDAHFISECGSSLGVADGVGGWVDVGVDAGKYSRELMSHAASYVEDTGSADPKSILAEAYRCTKSIGTSTACVLSVKDGCLRASNLGRLRIHSAKALRAAMVRRQQIYRAAALLQLPAAAWYEQRRSSSNADAYTCACMPGDLVIVGTDGLFDNLSIEDVCMFLDKDERAKPNAVDNLETLTHDLATLAYNTSRDTKAKTPFSLGATKNGYTHQGGKMDDITIVIAVVQAESIDVVGSPRALACARLTAAWHRWIAKQV